MFQGPQAMWLNVFWKISIVWFFQVTHTPKRCRCRSAIGFSKQKTKQIDQIRSNLKRPNNTQNKPTIGFAVVSFNAVKSHEKAMYREKLGILKSDISFYISKYMFKIKHLVYIFAASSQVQRLSLIINLYTKAALKQICAFPPKVKSITPRTIFWSVSVFVVFFLFFSSPHLHHRWILWGKKDREKEATLSALPMSHDLLCAFLLSPCFQLHAVFFWSELFSGDFDAQISMSVSVYDT